MFPVVKWLASNRTRAVFLVSVLIAASVLSVYAYLSSLTPQRGPRVAITSPPLEFSMELDKAEYAYEENITITFCLKNISNQTITVGKATSDEIDPSFGILFTEGEGVSPPGMAGTSNSLFHFGFSITDGNGTELLKRYRGSLQSIYSMDFEPEGYVKQRFIYEVYYYDREDDAFYSLPRGAYQVRGIFYGSCVPGFLTSALETPSITFMIG